MTAGTWWTEFRRSVGLPLLVAGTALGIWVLFVRPEWAAEWMTLATDQRVTLIVTGPLLVTAASWYAGREHRQGISELLDSTPLPRWRRHGLMLSTMLTAAVAAHLLAFVVAGAFVIRQTDYVGGGWWWIVLLSWVGLLPLAACGWLVGTVLPARLTAPLAGVATYLGIVVTTWDTQPWHELLPTGSDPAGAGTSPTALFVVVALVFLVLAGAGLLLLVFDERHRVWGPLALVGAAAVLFGARGAEEQWWWTPDPAATAPVCTETEPMVCVWRTHAKFLDATSAAIGPPLRRLGDLAPSQAVEQDPYGAEPDPDVLEIYLYDQIPLTGSELLRPGDLRRDAMTTPLLTCRLDYEQDERLLLVDRVVNAVLLREEHMYDGEEGLSVAVERFLGASDQQQDEFIQRYITLARECDLAALEDLVTTWTPG